MLTFIADEAHYDVVLNLAARARQTLWLGTADVKDLYVNRGGVRMPFVGLLSALVERGVAVRLIHAKRPGLPFRQDWARYPLLGRYVERQLCPRVHFKLVVIDSLLCYVGSANLTGAGVGMKSPRRRNFEAGLLPDEPGVVAAAMEEFDKVWRGAECPSCQRRQFCPHPVRVG